MVSTRIHFVDAIKKKKIITVKASSQLYSSSPSFSPSEAHATPPSVEEVKFRCGDETRPPSAAVSMVTDGKEEDDKEQLVFQMFQMYNRQQEKLNATLHTQRELETVRHYTHSFTLFLYLSLDTNLDRKK
ncbi:MAG: hypothetical protein ACRC4N_05060 [Gammaproteobacteria bacterium]